MEATPYVNPAHNGEALPSNKKRAMPWEVQCRNPTGLLYDPVTTEPFEGEASVSVTRGLYGAVDDKSTTGARRGL